MCRVFQGISLRRPRNSPPCTCSINSPTVRHSCSHTNRCRYIVGMNLPGGLNAWGALIKPWKCVISKQALFEEAVYSKALPYSTKSSQIGLYLRSKILPYRKMFIESDPRKKLYGEIWHYTIITNAWNTCPLPADLGCRLIQLLPFL